MAKSGFRARHDCQNVGVSDVLPGCSRIRDGGCSRGQSSLGCAQANPCKVSSGGVGRCIVDRVERVECADRNGGAASGRNVVAGLRGWVLRGWVLRGEDQRVTASVRPAAPKSQSTPRFPATSCIARSAVPRWSRNPRARTRNTISKPDSLKGGPGCFGSLTRKAVLLTMDEAHRSIPANGRAPLSGFQQNGLSC